MERKDKLAKKLEVLKAKAIKVAEKIKAIEAELSAEPKKKA